MEPIFLTPAFRSKLWGGRKLKTIFNYDIPVGKVGEAWLISAYKKDSAMVNAGKFKGQTLREIYQKHPELFGRIQAKEFPLLVKYLDANDNLSVQVHPDDEYAQKVEDDNGKAESWYVIQADPGAYLIYGHTAQTKEEFAKLVNEGKWDQLLRKVPVKAGDFFYVPAGTIHALTKGIVVIETQQSSDVTYRLYDYDRIDQKTGKKRELHTKKAIDVTNVPHVDPQICPKIHHEQDAQVKTLLESPVSPHFNLWQVEVAGQWATSLQQYPYLLVSVIAGSGQFQAAGDYYDLKLGTNFIIPNQLDNFTFTGKMSLIISSPNA